MTADEERRKTHAALFKEINIKLDNLIDTQTAYVLDMSLKIQALEKDKADQEDLEDLNKWRARWAGVCIGLSLTATFLAALRVSLLLFGVDNG